jgi:hypothetical protein
MEMKDFFGVFEGKNPPGPPPPRGVVQRKRVMVDYVIN